MPTEIRRVVTGHDANGLAIVAADGTVPATGGGDAFFSQIWTTDRSPADNDDPADAGAREIGITSPGGTVCRFVEMPPGARSPMHRTSSVDYGIVLRGTVDMELDGGETVHLGPGDVVVQRGTNHAWINRGTEPVLFAFVLVEAVPATAGGQVLDANI